MEKNNKISDMNIYQKINEIKKNIKDVAFTLDCELPSNLGSHEYASIGQYYTYLREQCIKYNLLFKWEVTNVDFFEKDAFKPQGKMAQHITTVECLATFINIDNSDESINYVTHASGSDSLDKGTSSASSLAFRNWFEKNFVPNHLSEYSFDGEISEIVEKTAEPKVPTYVPPQKKEAIKEEVVNTPQQQDSDKAKAEEIAEKIMEIRELSGNANYGASVINAITTEQYESADILEWSLKIQDKLDSLVPVED